MTEFVNAGEAGRGLERRSVLKGAAWSVPVIAAAVATPLAAASGDEGWNVSVSAGCVVGVAGVDVLPGFTISETEGITPPSTLTFTQQIVYTGTFDWNNNVPGSKLLAQTAARAIGVTNLGLYFAVGLIQGSSSNVSESSWTPGAVNPTYTELGTENGSFGARETTFTLTRTRTVTVTNLQAGGRAGITYLATAGITLPGAQLNNYLTANAGSGGAGTADDSAALTWQLLAIGDGCDD